MLTSTANPRVKQAIRVREGRDRELLFAEGERLVEELAVSSLDIIQAFHSEQPNDRAATLIQSLSARNVECLAATDAVLKALSDTVQPQGIIAIAKRPAAIAPEHLPRTPPPLLVALDGVQDPGNVGTILRTAEAAGAAAVIPLAGTADVFAPKVLRSAMGSAFRLPILCGLDAETLFAWADQRSIVTVAADGTATETHVAFDWNRSTLLVMGNEARGVSPALLRRCSARVRIPMRPPVESLNVAAAAAVLLFEAARQRGY